MLICTQGRIIAKKHFVCRVGEANLSTLCIGLFVQVPDWLTKELAIEILQSKIFLAIYYGGAAILALIGALSRRKYSERNLKKLLDGYLKKATAGAGKERTSVKAVIGQALHKAKGLPSRNTISFNPSDAFERAALLVAQRQSHLAIDELKKETVLSEATIGHAQHQLRLAQERAATAYYEIGTIHRSQDKGAEALESFMAMLRVNPGDQDALWWLGIQHRDLGSFDDAERHFNTLLHLVGDDPPKIAEIKRELGAVYLGWKDYGAAEKVLADALQVEKDSQHRRGVALTQESIGAVKTSRRFWTQAREAYEEAERVFSLVGDGESVDRVKKALDRMEHLRRQRNQARNGEEGTPATMH